jgi:hypothetical protein
MSTTDLPSCAASRCTWRSRRVTIRSAPSTLASMPLIETLCPRRRSQLRSTTSEASPAMNPGISSTGWASWRRVGERKALSASRRASSAL